MIAYMIQVDANQVEKLETAITLLEMQSIAAINCQEQSTIIRCQSLIKALKPLCLEPVLKDRIMKITLLHYAHEL